VGRRLREGMEISNSLLEREEASIDVVKKYIVLD
jgi:hypothetical protein